MRDDAILYERVSAARLSKRPDFLALLSDCAAGKVTHLLTNYQDRLLRGDKRDEATIEEALLSGRVTLLTTEGVVIFDETYDSQHALTFEMKAAFARHYLRDIAKKHREANRQRQRRGRRSGGFAPYGYLWTLDQRDPVTRQVITPARYETLPEEYAVVVEIFRRIRTEGISTLVSDFNRRLQATGSPKPAGSRRTSRAAQFWQIGTLHRILHNPHYAGFPAHRSTILRNGKQVTLPPSEWLLAENEQDYPHPVSLAEWQQVQQTLRSRQAIGAPRLACHLLLTGLLHCAQGRSMSAGNGQSYRCHCRVEGFAHPGMGWYAHLAETAAYHVLCEAFAALPADFAPQRRSKKERERLGAEYLEAVRVREEKREYDEHLKAHFALLLRSWSEEEYTAQKCKAKAERDAAEARVVELDAQLAVPDSGEIAPLLARLRQRGLPVYWEKATPAERRTLMHGAFARIDLEAPEAIGQQIRFFTVTPRAWLAPFYTPGRLDLREIVPHHSSRMKGHPRGYCPTQDTPQKT